jgi:hypothetical protein
MTENISESQDSAPEAAVAGAPNEGNAAETASGTGISTPSANRETGGADTPGEASVVSPAADPSPHNGSVEHYQKRVRDLQSQNDRLRHQLSSHEQLQEEQSRALLVLKDAMLRANPLVPAELLDTSSLDNLRASFQSAEQVVDRLRERLEEEQRSSGQSWRIPAGAPVRSGVDVESLSPGEKIRHGLAQKMGR